MATRAFLTAVLILVILSPANVLPASAGAQSNTVRAPGGEKHVLILHSYHPGLPWTDQIMAGMQEVLASWDQTVHFHVEYLDTKRHTDSEYFSHILDAILHYKLAARSFDLVLVSDNEALNFALDHRQDLFLETPIVFCGINDFKPSMLRGHQNITGVVETPRYDELMAQALALFPDTEGIIVVGGKEELCSRLNLEEFRSATQELEQRTAMTFLNDLPAHELVLRLRQLPPRRLVVINGPVRDRDGNVLSFEEKCKIIREATDSPLFSAWDIYMGQGIVGGSLVNTRYQGRRAAEMATRILSGTLPQSLPVEIPDRTTPRFDYLELKKYGIADRMLPAGHQLINQPPSFYKLSKQQAWLSATVLAGSLTISLVLTSNILQRKKAEANLRESEQSYRQLSQQFQIILDGIPDGLTLISPDMKVVWSNKGAGNYFNKTLGSVPGEYCCKLLYNRTALCENCPAIEAFRSGINEEATITTPEGRVLEVKAFPLIATDGEISHVIMLASDITEKNKLHEEAIRASRMASLGELAAGVAHEINNPNALILFNAELVRKACRDAAPILFSHYEEKGEFLLGGLPYSEMSQELPHLFTEMLEGANRIRRIVNDLKDFSRPEGPDLGELIDINEAVQASVRLIGNTIKKSTYNFVAHYGENIPRFKGSFQRIEQVVINLIANACHALPSRERGILVQTWYDRATAQVKLQVKDEGCGIPQESLPHITDPFFTTRREQGGTGLGLSVSSRIVKDHGGQLEFMSPPGMGTSAILALPACMEAIAHGPDSTDDGLPLPQATYSAG